MTGATFFSIGSRRSRWSPSAWWRAGSGLVSSAG
jgi:hypothetical protein